MTNHTDLIARLREVEAEQRKVAHGMDMDPKKTINWEHAETINAGIAALEAARAYVARLAELEKQEPVGFVHPGQLAEIHEGYAYVYPKQETGASQALFAAAGASPVEPSQAQPPAPSDTAITYMTGYSDGREWAGATNQAQPSQALELVNTQRVCFIRGWDARGMFSGPESSEERDMRMRELLDAYYPHAAINAKERAAHGIKQGGQHA